mgnify:CR=1 FL=1
MSIKLYQKKRKFGVTPEPKGSAKAKGTNRFVVHKHQARNLHYDFRLELPDSIDRGPVVLKSWAVPKGVPTVPAVKHLAVAVEDHPVSYINFKGIIPPGNYGAGRVEIWDQGRFQLLEHGKNFLKIRLQGKRLKGNYVLTKFGKGAKNWLVFKTKKSSSKEVKK